MLGRSDASVAAACAAACCRQVDADGILSVAAENKGTGKKEHITIKAEKGRLSKDEIDRMVAEAEEFAEQVRAPSPEPPLCMHACTPAGNPRGCAQARHCC